MVEATEDDILVILHGTPLDELNIRGGEDYRPILTRAGVWAWLEDAHVGQTEFREYTTTEGDHYEILMIKTSEYQNDEVIVM